MMANVRRLANTLIERLNMQRFFRGVGPEKHPVTLDRHRIFILPTREGLMFALILLAMLLSAINYNNSMAYLLTFLLGGMGMVAMLYTFRNMSRLVFHGRNADPVFAGEAAHFPVLIDNVTELSRYSLGLVRSQKKTSLASEIYTDIHSNDSQQLILDLPTHQRGEQAYGRFVVSTRYPLGLFRAWSYLDLANTCIVYPSPAGRQPLPPREPMSEQGVSDRGNGTEDFRSLRNYVPQDSPRHVHWKAAARSDVLLTKQFGGEKAGYFWLDWSLLDDPDTDARLSILCRWVLDAEELGMPYGLRLPGNEIAPERGDKHMHRCLTALALYAGPAS
ncbi:MAG: DUF58 domain-containing protein [Gammaproteobacteria bacterium]|nr:MAG: DUF58 domain-containing protein [Gammaproteobacteria bacterium]